MHSFEIKKNMKIQLSLLLLLIAFSTKAQEAFTGEQQKVYDVVMQMFDGMRAGDSTMVHKVFYNEVNLFTVFTNQSGDPVLHKGSLQKFLDAVGTPHDAKWDEPIWNTEIKIDGELAQVWTDYAFYYGGKFTHCGVDAFQLFKSTEGWKVFHLTDTRKTNNCEVPEDVEAKSKKP